MSTQSNPGQKKLRFLWAIRGCTTPFQCCAVSTRDCGVVHQLTSSSQSVESSEQFTHKTTPDRFGSHVHIAMWRRSAGLDCWRHESFLAKTCVCVDDDGGVDKKAMLFMSVLMICQTLARIAY